MSGDDWTVPAIEISSHCDREEQDTLKSGARTPRPYLHDGHIIQGDDNVGDVNSSDLNGEILPKRSSEGSEVVLQYHDRSGQTSVGGSDSGTEADDERRTFVKALPAPHLRPRKGLKTGESNADVLLTPSQLDDEGRRLSKDYFARTPGEKLASTEDKKAEEGKLLKIRLAEFARRSSEVAFMAVIVAGVLCGKGVLRTAFEWKRELLSHVLVILILVLAYPVKLSIVDSTAQARKIWQRFRVPASFDPATVLYPTLLPVLIALSVSSASSAPILPNIILGLSSLPQRLFPRSSRLGEINVLHWFIATIPLLVAENTEWPSEDFPAVPYLLKTDQPIILRPETLIYLYPLHHALLGPLQYLTTTSLLVSELHLLSAALINLLLLAESPQAIILKACLWIGGVALFLCTAAILHWNVVLMRVPKWKFRRLARKVGKEISVVNALRSVNPFRRTSATCQQTDPEDSDADEDAPTSSIKHDLNGRPLLRVTSLNTATFDRKANLAPKSAVETKPIANISFPESTGRTRPRSNTLPVLEISALPRRRSNNFRKEQSSNVLWCLNLTPTEARLRRSLYATAVYVVIVAVILVPVRYYVLEKALHGQEPIGWAIGYLFGQIEALRYWVYTHNLDDWIAMPIEPATWHGISLALPLSVPSMRYSFGSANTRLLLVAYWAPVLVVGLFVVFSLTTIVEVDTRRKVFHGVMVAMMLPSTFIDPCACALALTLILAIFLLLEVIRAGQVAPLGDAIGRFVAPYVDGRDLRGPVVVSHLFLLIGCAVPLWFSLASISRAGDLPWKDWELVEETREVAMVAGVVCVGMGDAAASLIGRRYGRHKWIWVGGKSIEGSAAFAVAVVIGLVAAKAWLVLGGWSDNSGSFSGHSGKLGAVPCVLAWQSTVAKATLCACGASFMEAVLTGANDNVVVPVALWLLVKGVRL